MRVLTGFPPMAVTCWRITVTISPSSAARAHPTLSRMLRFRAERALPDMADSCASRTKAPSCSTRNGRRRAAGDGGSMAARVAEEIMAPILLRHPENLHDLRDHADRRCLIAG